MHSDQSAATNEKCLLEEEQRRLSRERKAKMEEWRPRLFERNLITGDWVYKYAESVVSRSYYMMQRGIGANMGSVVLGFIADRELKL